MLVSTPESTVYHFFGNIFQNIAVIVLYIVKPFRFMMEIKPMTSIWRACFEKFSQRILT